jgi:uncharacterized membrane protein
MAEEIKQEEKKTDSKNVLSTILKVLLGLVFLVAGVGAIVVWRQDLISLIKGSIGLFLILASLITFAIAKD